MGIVVLAAVKDAQHAAERRREQYVTCRVWTEAVAKLENLRRLRGEMTDAGAIRAWREQLALGRAGVSEDAARQMLEALAREGIDLSPEEFSELGYAWTGRTRGTVPARAFQDPGVFVLRYGQRPDEVAALAAAGRRRVQEDPAIRLHALRMASLAEREPRLGDSDGSEGTIPDNLGSSTTCSRKK